LNITKKKKIKVAIKLPFLFFESLSKLKPIKLSYYQVPFTMVFPSTALNFSLFSKKVKIKLKEKFLKLESSSTPKIFSFSSCRNFDFFLTKISFLQITAKGKKHIVKKRTLAKE